MYKHLKNYFTYLFFREGGGREGERERNINVWLPLTHPTLGTWPATQACVLTGNQPVTLWFTGQCSIHWATPARAVHTFLKLKINQGNFFSLPPSLPSEKASLKLLAWAKVCMSGGWVACHRYTNPNGVRQCLRMQGGDGPIGLSGCELSEGVSVTV